MKKIYWLNHIVEFVFIVLGILVALGINNWNETRQERIREFVILQNLKEEFVFNKEELKRTEEVLLDARQATEFILQLFGNNIDEASGYNIDSLIYFTMYAPTFNPSHNVLNDITYSGNMNVITDTKLKQLLLEWASKMEDFDEQENNMYYYLNRHAIPKLEKLMSFRNIEKYGPMSHVGSSKLIENNYQMLDNLEAENIFDNHLYELTNVHNLYPSLYDCIDKILKQLE